MFSLIAPRYDLANDVLSFGLHRRWKGEAVRASGARGGQVVLDCATGTGDLAIRLKQVVGDRGRVVATDVNLDMLRVGATRAAAAGAEIHFETADALQLPYPDASFDLSTIAFGIRNTRDPSRCLSELARVVKPGGRVVVLEFGQPTGAFGLLYRSYARCILPTLGGLLTGQRAAYHYLPRSAAAFPSGKAFLDLLDRTQAFSARHLKALCFGLASIYVGVVSSASAPP